MYQNKATLTSQTEYLKTVDRMEEQIHQRDTIILDISKEKESLSQMHKETTNLLQSKEAELFDILGDPLEGCSAAAEEMSKRGGKRKAGADDGPTKKKKMSQKETTVASQRGFSMIINFCLSAKFQAKYEQQNKLGQGCCGSVFAGYRKADHLPVAIKHIAKDRVLCKHVDNNGNQLSVEVAVMLNLASGTSGASGSAVSLLDWYDLNQELILVLGRPVPSKDLSKYIEGRGSSLPEDEAKIIPRQLVNAATELQEQNIFHCDIKLENILIETRSDVLMDFGLSCFLKKGSFYRTFYG
ncbi:serine/threonine-protein kinase pim-1-like [Sander lucioperca]|uniref:serine/threonine-protein kinase pim-1-like n=1 Tax=Sander lucioperca TaxID=283035 RepID=UPI00125DE554|nr:serine/threonine-protein kinase pim-1-like [Sander lucioperca]